MDERKLVFRETGVIAIGVAAGTLLMFGVFALIGRFDMHVLFGGLIGAVVAVLNFFLMAVSAMSAADKAAQQNVKGGKSQIRLSYAVRMLFLFVLLFACVKSGVCNAVAAVVPLLLVRPVITLAEFFRKPRSNEV